MPPWGCSEQAHAKHVVQVAHAIKSEALLDFSERG